MYSSEAESYLRGVEDCAAAPWIQVGMIMPKDPFLVCLCLAGEMVWVCRWDGDSWTDWNDDDVDGVTHWAAIQRPKAGV